MPVRVATVLSIATVTAAEPLKLVPDKPVPIVKALVVVPALAHDVSVPLVVKNFPLLLVWLGTSALKAVLAVVAPVPPFATATVPVTLEAVPVVFWFHVGTVPDNWEYGRLKELSVVSVLFALAVMLAAVPVVFWFSVGNVQFVKVPDAGVPKAGVTSVGLVAKTTEPVPVAVVDPVPPFSMATIPVTFAAVPVVFWFNVGNVQFVSVPDAGVPKAGAINVVPVSVNPLIVVTVFPSATAVVPSVAAVLKFASS